MIVSFHNLLFDLGGLWGGFGQLIGGSQTHVWVQNGGAPPGFLRFESDFPASGSPPPLQRPSMIPKRAQNNPKGSFQGSQHGSRKLQKRFHNGTIILSNHLFASFHRVIISSSQHLIIAIENAERGERSEPREAFAEQPSTS